MPPTSQNQARIENDLRSGVEPHIEKYSDDELKLLSERIIRNYDPCISCATHFLELEVERQ
jgi:coenzyme F420-reducing hydrogenase alpha subunit